MSQPCNICGNDQFNPGPSGRMSATGLPPKCGKCNSLERHRTYRQVFLKLKDLNLMGTNVLQFSQDLSVVPEWFNQYEVSIFEGENSLDLQKIDRNSNQYDMVICNHVLEHVPYDNAALHELLRVVRDDGFVFLAVPDPARRKTTTDWGYAKAEDHGHYRIYGADIENMFRKYIPYASILRLNTADPVTKMEDRFFILSKNQNLCNQIKSGFKNFPECQDCEFI